ncbi:polysaccharide biosynthesis protein [uncultured Leuconostoc sp.]|uniref:polysaccharide biosynthesis protein n=1 Tax=uncultured Leuconostoc sp. TaxID=173262 RepID=UPI0025F34446|nr:polysaccharide biosynthesis protein [uncultured Leuconostoc sp.]
MKQANQPKNQLTNGTAWLAFGNIISRVLGALYVIPWTLMLGTLSLQANTLMGKGYNLYQFFLMLSTAGLPSAVAKLTAQLQGDKKQKFIGKATVISLFAGLLCSLLLWFLAPLLSVRDHNVTPVLRSLSFAVLIFPFLSVLRGQLQGELKMADIAKSDIIEQFVRVAYMLSSAYFILNSQHGSWVTVVVHSTFAASLGAWVATIFLLFRIYHTSKSMQWSQPITQASINQDKQDINLWHILIQALPFVLIGGFLSAYQWIDQFSFHPLMATFYAKLSSEDIETLFGIFNFNTNKLIMIIVSLSVSIAATVLPLVTKHRFDSQILKKYVSQAYLLFCLITLPACVTLYTLAKPIYILFYGNYAQPQQYIPMVQISAPIALLMGLTTVLAMILQGLSKTRIALRAIASGMLVKLGVQPIMIYLTGTIGALLATLISMAVITILMSIYVIRRFHLLSYFDTQKLNVIYISTLLLLVVFLLISRWEAQFISPTRINSGIFLVVVGSIFGSALLAVYKKFGILGTIKNK